MLWAGRRVCRPSRYRQPPAQPPRRRPPQHRQPPAQPPRCRPPQYRQPPAQPRRCRPPQHRQPPAQPRGVALLNIGNRRLNLAVSPSSTSATAGSTSAASPSSTSATAGSTSPRHRPPQHRQPPAQSTSAVSPQLRVTPECRSSPGSWCSTAGRESCRARSGCRRTRGSGHWFVQACRLRTAPPYVRRPAAGPPRLAFDSPGRRRARPRRMLTWSSAAGPTFSRSTFWASTAPRSAAPRSAISCVDNCCLGIFDPRDRPGAYLLVNRGRGGCRRRDCC